MLVNKTQLNAVSMASKDQTRAQLQCLRFRPGSDMVEATDGHKLVRVTSMVTEEDTGEQSFSINKDVLKTLQDILKPLKDSTTTITYNGNGSVNCELPPQSPFKELSLQVEDGRFPDTDQIFNDRSDGIKFGFDARKMRDICDLMIKADTSRSRGAVVMAEMRVDRDNADKEFFYLVNDNDDNKIEFMLAPCKL